MIDYKFFLGVLATAIAFVSYAPYLINIVKKKTKPHAFSWLVWGVITAVAFFVQVGEQGGAGSWVTGFSAAVCFLIFILALIWGDRRFVLFDWANLVGAMFVIFLWWFTGDPVISVILVIVIDILGFLPSYRKGFYKPHEETAVTFGLNSLKFAVSIPALEVFAFATLAYPIYLVFANALFAIMLVVRRKILDSQGEK